MSVSSIAARARSVRQRLARRYPKPRTELTWTTPWELLVATILSAQCTDVRVNLVTPRLFARFPTVQAFAAARPRQVEPYVRTCGLFRNKARAIVAAAR
ncbi:MAG: endonuclease III, partial [Desulfomicrobium sp.]|nr:endonuclease III [Desulfomicrobium sp.]